MIASRLRRRTENGKNGTSEEVKPKKDDKKNEKKELKETKEARPKKMAKEAKEKKEVVEKKAVKKDRKVKAIKTTDKKKGKPDKKKKKDEEEEVDVEAELDADDMEADDMAEEDKADDMAEDNDETNHDMEDGEEVDVEDPKELDWDFGKLSDLRIIDKSMINKSITYRGEFEGKTAVVLLEKTLFEDHATQRALKDKESECEKKFSNDIYSSYVFRSPELNDIKATVVYPANEELLAKYTYSDSVLFNETPELYKKIVEPFIERRVTKEVEHVQWVYNILDGKSEGERVILEDPDQDAGFMLVEDLKSSGKEGDINLLAICNRRDIRSLRDLDDSHLSLLENILDKAPKAIQDKYKTGTNQLRAFVHYHPTFYHFHVHFKEIVPEPNKYLASDRDHLLSTIINNINICSDYYKKSTLTYPLKDKSELHDELKKKKGITY